MNPHLQPLVLLQPGQPLRLRVVGHRRLTVHRGRLWLTQSGSHADHFLSAGQTFEVDPARRPVVESDLIEPASVTLQPIGAKASFSAWWSAAQEALSRRLKQAWGAHCRRRQAAYDRRVVLELDEHQLRDIGAPPSILMAARALAASRQRWAEHDLPIARQDPTWRS